MTKTTKLFAGFTVALASCLEASSAYALNDHSWVSASTGTGTACTRVAPCSSFSTAQAATNAGGVISVLDPGDYGGLIISKSLTVRAEGVDGGMAITGSNGFLLSVFAGPSDIVTIEGLRLDGTGIVFGTGGEFHVVRCVITNSTLPGDGILLESNNPSKLSVTDTVITNAGNNQGGGIVIRPQPGGNARVALERVTINGNTFGIAADGSGSTGGINMTIADSMIGGNRQDGIVATTSGGGAPIGLLVTNTKSVNNAFGIRSLGPNVTVRVKNSDVTGNGAGLSFSGGGALLTYGNNAVNANGGDGAFSGSVGLQ
jgi:hypothetical protein